MSTAASPAVTKPQPLRVFISYSHKDDALREKFVTALGQLQRDKLIEGWDHRRIAPGVERTGVIDERLTSAEIVILLVSNDFLASNYCNEIELETALKRHEAKLARVIPVILKPCDWETSRFGKLQALPKDGKPVIDWKTEDHGFLDVVKALRSVAIELRNYPYQPTVSPVLPTTSPNWRARWPLIAGIAALLTSLAIAGTFWLKQHHIQQAAALVTQGNQLLNQHDWKKSEDAYYQATTLDPENPDAFSGLGVLYDLEKDPEAAVAMFAQAASVSPLPQHKSNLADAYFKLGQYKRAIDTYAGIDQFPYAAIESAKINRLRNNLDEAAGQNSAAIRWLNDPAIATTTENKLPWYFTTDTKSIWLRNPEQKLCYARFELSITLFLQDNLADSQKNADAAHQACERLYDVAAILTPELERLANERPELAARANQYAARFLPPPNQ